MAIHKHLSFLVKSNSVWVFAYGFDSYNQTNENNAYNKLRIIYYSKFANDQLFDIAYFCPIANDTPVRGPHYCVLK